MRSPGRFRPRATYANVTATVALVLAAGGSAYAAATIGSEDVVNGSLRSVDIRDNALRARDIHDGTLGGPDIAGESLTAGDIEDLVDSRGVVKLSLGETATLLRKGPISLVASCEPGNHDGDTPDVRTINVVAHSTEAGTVADFGVGMTGVIDGENEFGPTSGGSAFEWRGYSYLVATPGGETLAGHVSLGVYALDAECAAIATGAGGDGIRGAPQP